MTTRTVARIASVSIAVAFVGVAVALVMPSAAAIAVADKCTSSIVSTNCAHQCQPQTNAPEKCEICSVAVDGICVLDTNPATAV